MREDATLYVAASHPVRNALAMHKHLHFGIRDPYRLTEVDLLDVTTPEVRINAQRSNLLDWQEPCQWVVCLLRSRICFLFSKLQMYA